VVRPLALTRPFVNRGATAGNSRPDQSALGASDKAPDTGAGRGSSADDHRGLTPVAIVAPVVIVDAVALTLVDPLALRTGNLTILDARPFPGGASLVARCRGSAD
jgi:hypothetical protein